MACGCPTLVSTGGSLPEIVGDAGLQVAPTDEAEMSLAIERLWEDDELRRELGRLGQRRAAAHSWLSVARQTVKVYEQAAACAC